MQRSQKSRAEPASMQRRSTTNPVIVRGSVSLSDIRKLAAGSTSRSKYRNRKVELDGKVFDSKHEAHRWIDLKYMERAKIISNLRRQVRFELIPNQYKDGKLIERKVEYIADFVYCNQYGQTIVEDAKGCRTDVYKIKRKMMLKKYSIEIQEV